jgi:hypothetical protein
LRSFFAPAESDIFGGREFLSSITFLAVPFHHQEAPAVFQQPCRENDALDRIAAEDGATVTSKISP